MKGYKIWNINIEGVLDLHESIDDGIDSRAQFGKHS